MLTRLWIKALTSSVSTRTASIAPLGNPSAILARSMTTASTVEGLSDNCWQQSQQSVRHPALSRDLETDVCVVGAGIAGLTTAYQLAAAGTIVLVIATALQCLFAGVARLIICTCNPKPCTCSQPDAALHRCIELACMRKNRIAAGKRVVVLEGRVRGAGQSGKDTGELLAWNNHSLSTLEHAYGKQRTAQVVKSQQDAIAAVCDTINAESIHCQCTLVKGYINASQRKLNAECKAFGATENHSEQVRLCSH